MGKGQNRRNKFDKLRGKAKHQKKPKLKTIMDETATNVHHAINKCRWWSNHEFNLIRTKVLSHNWVHRVHWNETPAEIIRTDVEYFKWPLTKEIRADLIEVLDRHLGKEHKPQCFKEWWLINWGTRNSLWINHNNARKWPAKERAKDEERATGRLFKDEGGNRSWVTGEAEQYGNITEAIPDTITGQWEVIQRVSEEHT